MDILIVEDDLHLAESLGQIVRGEDYNVDIVNDGMDGLYYATNNDYDLIILDVMLPKMNGFDVIKMLRKQGMATPTLMLTARSEIADRVSGLDSGADDYMTKPFAPEELLARIRALTRRKGEVQLHEITFNGLTLNLSTYSLTMGSKTVNLSHKEFQIMQLLMSNPKNIVSKETLIIKVWGRDSEAEDNNVEAYISFLRKKLTYLGAEEWVKINTVRMAGYMLIEVKPCC